MHPLEAAVQDPWWAGLSGWIITTALAGIAAFAALITIWWEVWRFSHDAPRVEWEPEVGRYGLGFRLVLWNIGDAAAVQTKLAGSEGVQLHGGSYANIRRLNSGENLDAIVFVGADVQNPTQAEIDAAQVRLEYLTSPVRARRRRALVIQLVDGRYWIEKMRP